MQQRAPIYPHRIYSFKFQRFKLQFHQIFVPYRHETSPYLENKFLIITKSERDFGTFLGGPVAGSALPMQGAWV